MRQYTSNGRINGYNGPLDLNYFRGTREQWDKYANPSKTQTLTDSGSATRVERGLRGVGDRLSVATTATAKPAGLRWVRTTGRSCASSTRGSTGPQHTRPPLPPEA